MPQAGRMLIAYPTSENLKLMSWVKMTTGVVCKGEPRLSEPLFYQLSVLSKLVFVPQFVFEESKIFVKNENNRIFISIPR